VRKITLLIILIISLSVISFVGYSMYSKQDEKIELVSPVPDFLSITKNNQVSTLSLWLPILSNFIKGRSESRPEITAKSALIYDLTTNKVLYEKNPKEKLPMASLTKIMTAIVALENRKQNDKYIVRASDLVGEDSMGLTEGEILSLDELLYGLVLTSGNDAGETIASNYKDGRDAFVESMNNKAKALGVKDTNFTNPTGLQGDGDQHTTTYDLLAITRYALSNFPLFRKVASTFEYTIGATNNHKEFYLQNETNLLTSYPGVKGVKTGYTPEAGFCLVTYLDYDGHQIVGIILGSQNRREEMKELLDYSLRLLNIPPPNHG
jgi:D-alanyl-D-alanine carboxypeptidase (penicillin-binding protein 5/6)